jgi:hypothetical protein
MTVPYDVVAEVIKVLDLVSKGKVPTQACDEARLSYNTFCTYTARYQQLRDLRVEAEDRCYDVLADRLLHIYEEVGDPKMANVISSNTKWLLERRRAKQYGTKSTLEVNLTADREVLDALQAAKARAQGVAVKEISADEVLDLTVLNGVATALGRSIPAPTEPWDEAAYQAELAAIS